MKRVLRKHRYLPDKREKATQTVLEQAEVLSTVLVGSEQDSNNPHQLLMTRTIWIPLRSL